MKYLYIALCIAGTAVPYYFFVPFVIAHGLNMSLFMRQLMATPVSAFFAADVVMSSVALWAFIAYENVANVRCGSGGCASSPMSEWACRWRCRCFSCSATNRSGRADDGAQARARLRMERRRPRRLARRRLAAYAEAGQRNAAR
jgi:hypothetical protein